MEKRNAIIIEDDVSLAGMFAESLKDADYSCRLIYDGEKAIEYLNNNVPFLIVLDLYLPKISGEEILKYIHSKPELANTYVIIVSADAFYAETLRDEVDYVLLKPISFQQLRDLAMRLASKTSEEI